MNTCENCKFKYIVDKQYNYYKVYLAESAKYTSTIITVAYVSFLTIIGQIHKFINKENMIAISICLLISIFTFIVNEIWNMKLQTEYNKIIRNTWDKFHNGEINFDNLDREIDQKTKNTRKIFDLCYPYLFWGSLIFGVIAVLITLNWGFQYLLK